MVKSAKLLLESVFVSSYDQLKNVMIGEFTRKYTSVDIHNKLRERFKAERESIQDYVLEMKKIATLSKEIETASVIRYIVDGLQMRSDFKLQLYCCTSYYELNEKYDMYERVKANEKQSMERLPSYNKIERTSKARCYMLIVDRRSI
ncbi:hypothetical protein ACLKA7_005450 [Drosophila subpalustris]